MVGLFIKKSFFDSWDNLISLVLINLFYLLILGGFYGAWTLLELSFIGALALFLVVLLLHSLFVGISSYLTREFVNYRKIEFSQIKEAFSQIWAHSLLYFAIEALLCTLLFVILFYLSIGKLLSAVIAVLLLWLLIATLLALPFYFPLALEMRDDKPLKSLKKAYIIVADNIAFALFFGLYSLVNGILTLLFATIIPGASGLHLSRNVAIKLLMIKYDYLQEHPKTKKSNIPWDDLLFEEREKVGRRTFKGMIFPWKE